MSTVTSPARTRKPRGQGASRRGEIIEAAKRLFLQDGIEHATMRRIAADVGVSSTALYVYFPDKLAILDAIAEAMFDRLLVVHAQSQAADLPPLLRFRAGLVAYVDLALARPDEYRLVFEAKTMQRCRDIAAADQSFAVLQQGVADLMRADLFRGGAPLLVAEALWACMHGVAMLLLNQSEHLESEPRLLVETVIDAAMKGFAASN